MNITTTSLVCLALLPVTMTFAASDPIPYPDALDDAAIVQATIDDVNSKAMIVGNGDINALIFSRGNELIMQVAKNDVWDARLDTSKDVPLLKVDVAKHAWTGGGMPASWNHPYPTQTPPCLIRIPLKGGIEGTKLDVKRATATITTTAGTVTVRALSQANVFLIETENAIALEGFPQKFLPAPEKQQNESSTSVKQVLPGDIDTKGMTMHSVMLSKGGRHAVAVATSRTFENPLAEAQRLAESALRIPAQEVIQSHEARWREFWSKSGVELADKDFQNWWYRQLYYFRCLSKAGGYPIALQGGYNEIAKWHGTWTMNYNAQQTYWAAFSSNHPELAEPFIDLAHDYLPRARWYAKTVFGCDGAATPHNLWPFEPDPATCKSVNKRQLGYLPWSYCIGTAGHIASIPWLHYAYTGDKARLKDKIYPFLRDVALFYTSFADKCQVKDGKVVFGPSVDPEHTPFGYDNSPYDLAWARHTLRSAIQAATDLAVDEDLVLRWQQTLDKLPDYSIYGDPGKEVIRLKERRGGYNIVTPVVPLFPAEQASWFSPESEKALFKRTIEWIANKYNRNNSVVMLNVARARMSMADAAYADTKSWFKGKEQPNGLFYWQAHGFYMSEQTAVAGLINEFLMQSVDHIIRVFPALPENQDARFADLRAKGGFLVSAARKSGQVVQLGIRSTIGGKLQLLSPWPTTRVHPKGEANKLTELTPDERGILILDSLAGQDWVFVNGRKSSSAK